MNKKIIKYSNLELISVLILFSLLPLVITNLYFLIVFIVNKSFNYPLNILLAEVVISFCLIVISLIVQLTSKTIEVFHDKLIIKNETIYFKNITYMSYTKMNILLLPIMYFYKNGNGLILTISYLDLNNFNKKINVRLTKKKLSFIEGMLNNERIIEYR